MKKIQRLARGIWVVGFVVAVAVVVAVMAELCGVEFSAELADAIGASMGWVLGATMVALAGDIVLNTQTQLQLQG